MSRVCKVLIVEDNAQVQQLLGDVFGHEGYHFTVVSSGAEMRQALVSDPDIDVAVIDTVLPGGVDGFSLAKELTDQGYGVILVTGDHRNAERVERSGHRYMLKPFRIASLLALVDQVLSETKRDCQPARGMRNGCTPRPLTGEHRT